MSAVVAQSTPTSIPTPAELGFDPADLRKKYTEERAKRLRADGNNQYQEITGKYAYYTPTPMWSRASPAQRYTKNLT